MAKIKKSSSTQIEPIPQDEQPYDIPATWQWVKLGDVCSKINYGYTEKSNTEVIGPKFLRITDIQDNNVDWDNVPYCKIDDKKLKQYLLNDKDIVIARTGATTGKSFLIHNPINSVFASYLIRIQLKKEILIPEHVWSYFQTIIYWKLIEENQSGLAQPGVNATKLSNLPIPLPPLPEQKRIVERLDSMLGKIKEARELISDARDSFEIRRASILAKAFTGELTEKWRALRLRSGNALESESSLSEVETSGHPYEIPETWQWVKLGEVIINSNSGFACGKKNELSKDDENAYPHLRPNNIGYQGALNFDKIVYIPEDKVDASRKTLQEGDVLFNNTNSKELVGRSVLISDDCDYAYSNHITKIQSNPNLIISNWLCYSINKLWIDGFWERICKKWVGQAGVNQNDLTEKTIIPLPPLEEQEEIVRILDTLLSFEDEAKVMADLEDELDLLEKSILSRAFRGELGTQDKADEPVSELLKRISAEKG